MAVMHSRAKNGAEQEIWDAVEAAIAHNVSAEEFCDTAAEAWLHLGHVRAESAAATLRRKSNA